MSFDAAKVGRILKTVPSRFRGPGGAVAVVKDGNLVAQNVWGYADLERRIHMTSKVLIPICSITKQFVSALLLDLTENPPPTMAEQRGSFQEQMIARLREILPPEFVDDANLTVDNLVDMCSGIRDYWAVCTVQGSRPETVYSIEADNPDMLRRTKSLHFQPGTEYSYSNTNFNIVERLIEHVTKDSLDSLLAERIFGPAKMTTARLCPRTDRLPPPIIGYEGTEQSGFVPAPNFIEWSADAGMVASLDDMIAYEQSFDRKCTDTENQYRSTIQPRNYVNGAPSKYRYGLRYDNIEDVAMVGHGGGLRGFRLQRMYVESERLSVIVLFNHMADSTEAARYIIKEILNIPDPKSSTVEPVRDWFGSYLDDDTQLSVRISPGDQGKIKVLYSRATEMLTLVDPSHAKSLDIDASVEGNTVQIHRRDENRALNARRLARRADTSDPAPVQGTYQCSETESTFICEGEGDMLYGMFNGCFGKGPPHIMTHLGEDVWVLADPRSMDFQAPGDWTLVFTRDQQGTAVKVNVGCWLARKLEFVRV